MTYTSQYNISIRKLVGRLLPWFARGRRLFYLLCGSLSPLKSLHDNFITWAQEKHFEARLTFQVMSMEWYLNKQLKQYFVNENDSFKVDLYAHKNYNVWVDPFSKTAGYDYSNYQCPFISPTQSFILKSGPVTFEFEHTDKNYELFGNLEADILFSDGSIGPEAETISHYKVTFSESDVSTCIGKKVVGLNISDMSEYKKIYFQDSAPVGNVYAYKISEEVDTDFRIYYRDEVTGSTANRFNLSAPNFNSEKITEEEYCNVIKQIISKYSLIRKYTIVIQNL